MLTLPAELCLIVALRKESVDRNWWVEGDRFFYYRSLSARRAWIEIKKITKNIACSVKSLSARRAWIEIGHEYNIVHNRLSLSARRAWIEILLCPLL